MTSIGVGVGVPKSTRGAAGTPIPLGFFLVPDTWVRNGQRFSLASGLSLGLDEPDDFCRAGQHISGIAEGALNIVSPNLTEWNSAVVVVDDLGGDTFSLTTNAGGTITSVSFSVASGSTDRIARFQARVVSGTPLVGDVFTFREGTATRGTPFNMTDLTGEFQDIDFSVTSAETTNAVGIRFVNTSILVIEVRAVRAADATKTPAQFPIGSAAGIFYPADIATVTAPPWPGADRTLFVAQKDFTTGEISSTATTAPTVGDYVLDGSVDGNAEFISFVSADILTPEQIITGQAIIETILTQPVGPCDVTVMSDDEGALLVDDEATFNILSAPE